MKGKTVLDVGAGCGESAYFYFQHGAKRVIGIESNRSNVKYLELNKRLYNRYGFEFKFYLEKFDLLHLGLNFDFCKMDIEGGEVELLKLKKIDFPLSVEVHSQDLEAAFTKRGFRTEGRTVSRLKTSVCIMNNFQNLKLD